MHGLAFLGLCAPLTYVAKIGKLYLASTYTEDFSEPWGSHPDIDNKFRRQGKSNLNDGYELSRQENCLLSRITSRKLIKNLLFDPVGGQENS